MTVAQFRANFDLTQQWKRELENNDLLKLVLFDVMTEAHPARFAIHGDKEDDVSPTRAAIELGLTRGFSKYADTLRLLSQPIPKNQPLGETVYAKEEIPNA